MVLQAHTFLFADLVGFTRFTAEHGDERAADLAVSFHGQVCELAQDLGCCVVKAIGDAVMVRSDSGDVAVELGKRILALAEQKGFPLVRVGLDTGPAVERDGDWFGSTVNTASRVASLAHAGELLMTERTRDAFADVADLDDRGRHPLKGLSEHALFGQARATPRGRAIGRGPRSGSGGGGQALVDRAHGARSLAHGGGHALHRAVPDVPGGEHPGHGGLEREASG
jgi:adenylate cyclase